MPPRGIGIRSLTLLEAGGRSLRRIGLGPLVDRLGPALGGRAARFEVEVDGLRLTGNHVGQLYYLRELAQARREVFFTELLVGALRPGRSAVDGGAHIGYMTLQLARAAGPGGRVVAFEPNPEVQPVLALNVRRNGIADRVRVSAKALGAAPGSAVLHVVGGGDASRLWPSAGGRDVVPVEVTCLDRELAGEPVPDVVKLDLEGAEVAALQGMRDLLGREAEAPTLFVECNAEALAAAGSSPAQLLGLLGRHGYVVWRIDEAQRLLFPATASELEGDYVNLVGARGDAVHTYEALAA